MIRLRPAQLSSLAEALSDDGDVVAWRRGSVRLAAAHISLTDAWQVEVEVGGVWRVVAVGGFCWRDELEAAEAWFRATVWTGRVLRRAIEGVIMVLMAARERYGAVVARVRRDGGKSQKLVGLMGFEPTALVAANDLEFRYWRFEVRV